MSLYKHLTTYFNWKPPKWLVIVWGGFNAGAIMGILDSLMIMFFGLASFDRGGQIVGFMIWDAIGLGILGSILAVLVFFCLSRIPRITPRLLSVINLVLLFTISICLTLANIGWSFTETTGTPPDNAPHIVLLTLDTVRADSIGAGGNPIVRTPTLDRLARMGRQFCNAICPVPMTTPSHASMLTATIPAVHGARENRYRLGPDNLTLTEILRGVGYRTAAFLSCFPLDRRFGLNQGFMLYDDQFGVPGDLRQASWFRIWKNYRSRGRLERNCRWTNSLALPWIRKYSGDGNPLFLWVHYFDPHAPYAPPAREQIYYRDSISPKIQNWPDEYAQQNAEKALLFTDIEPRPGRPEEMYLGEISEMDRALGELMHQLAISGILTNSLITAIADHGESFGEHGHFYTHGEDVYEPALAVPLILYTGNDRCRTGLDDRLASGVDIATTILPFTHLETPSQMEGFDLLSDSRRQRALIENYGIIMNSRAMKQRGLRTAELKMIAFPDNDYHALYDLDSDPGERQNIQAQHSQLSESMLQDTRKGFADTEHRRRISSEDLSAETLKNLESLGYIVPGL